MCPNCECDEFISNLNSYDVLTYKKGAFEIIKSECIDEYVIYCRECGLEVEDKDGILTLKNDTPNR